MKSQPMRSIHYKIVQRLNITLNDSSGYVYNIDTVDKKLLKNYIIDEIFNIRSKIHFQFMRKVAWPLIDPLKTKLKQPI